ncbi:TPA: hypothetical protein SMM66_000460 [Proteus mirabilis]|nr:hypothetical protein [Proteus mirabilis]
MSNSNEDKALKKTGMTLFKEIIAMCISSGNISIGGIIATFLDVLNEHSRAIDKDKFYNFVMGIQEYDEGDIDVSNESFIALVKRLYLDDESSKTDMYAKLAVALAKSNLNPHEKIFYIGVLSNLTYTDIQLARKYYIYNKFEISGYQNKNDKLIEISSSTDGFVLKSINNLAYNGLLYDAAKGKAGQQFYLITDVMIKFLELIFKNNELLPSAINEIEKEKYDVLIVKERIFQPMTNDYREDIEIKEFCDCFIGKFSSDDVRISSIYWDEWKKYKVTTRQFLFIIPDGDDFRIYFSSDVNTLYSFMKGDGLKLTAYMPLNKKDYFNTSLIKEIKENLKFIGKDKYI